MNRKPGVVSSLLLKNQVRNSREMQAGFNMSMGDYLFSMLADSESNISDYLECGVDE